MVFFNKATLITCWQHRLAGIHPQTGIHPQLDGQCSKSTVEFCAKINGKIKS